MNTRTANVYFRAEAGNKTGFGHFYRCLAIAEILFAHRFNRFKCVFLIREENASMLPDMPETMSQQFLPGGQNSDEEARFLHEKILSEQDILVLDGYSFDNAYQEKCRASGAGMVLIDDFIKDALQADVVINHAGGIYPHQYNSALYTSIYTGPSYAMLRRPFLQAAGSHTKIKGNKGHIVICFGGSDKYNLTEQVLQACVQSPKVKKVHVIIGNGYKYLDSLNSFESLQDTEVVIEKNLDAETLKDRLEACHLAITSASTIAYEACCTGTGLIAVVYTANQRITGDFLQASGCAGVLDSAMLNDNPIGNLITNYSEKVVEQQIENQQKHFVNPEQNIVNIFNRLVSEQAISIRFARMEDMEYYFHLANDPEVRNNSIQCEEVPWETHRKWFAEKVNNPFCILMVAEEEEQPLGQVRFDKVDVSSCEISFSVNKELRGKGYGALIVRKGILKLIENAGNNIGIRAVVKADNNASRRIFEQLGFRDHGTIVKNNRTFIVFHKS